MIKKINEIILDYLNKKLKIYCMSNCSFRYIFLFTYNFTILNDIQINNYACI